MAASSKSTRPTGGALLQFESVGEPVKSITRDVPAAGKYQTCVRAYKVKNGLRRPGGVLFAPPRDQNGEDNIAIRDGTFDNVTVVRSAGEDGDVILECI